MTMRTEHTMAREWWALTGVHLANKASDGQRELVAEWRQRRVVERYGREDAWAVPATSGLRRPTGYRRRARPAPRPLHRWSQARHDRCRDAEQEQSRGGSDTERRNDSGHAESCGRGQCAWRRERQGPCLWRGTPRE